MEYVRVYTDLLTLPKWQELSYRARAVLLAAWLYAGKNDTNGYVPDVARKVIDYSAAADRELQGRWWNRNGTGWQLHDWGDHQVDAEELRADREHARARAAERAKEYRRRRREERARG